MGSLTRGTIISEGLLMAGNSSLSARAQVWFNAWLRSQYGAFEWPFLQRRSTGVALNSGVQSLSFGQGAVTSSTVGKIKDPVRIYDSNYSTLGVARIRQLIGDQTSWDESVNNPATFVGLPTWFKVRADSSQFGKWSLVPLPFPDKNYLLAIDWVELPADLTSDSQVPIYPNDQTMIQAVVVKTLQWMKMPEYFNQLEVLRGMAVDDRIKFGEVHGTNDILQLDDSTFR